MTPACLLAASAATASVPGRHLHVREEDNELTVDLDDAYPQRGTILDLVPASRGETFMSWAEAVSGDEIVVTAPKDRSMRPVEISVGDRVDVVWKAAGELCSLPCALAAVERSEQPRWVLRRAGAVQRGQRRDAVRAPMTAPVQLGSDAARIGGTTVDLSEGGLRCVLDKGPAPDWLETPGEGLGTVVPVWLQLSDLTVSCLGEITRRFPRDDARTELSLRFIGLSEHDQDGIRRRIFDRLRDLRRRGLL